MRAGVEGWLHVPVRGGEHVDDEIDCASSRTASLKQRPSDHLDHAVACITAWMNTT